MSIINWAKEEKEEGGPAKGRRRNTRTRKSGVKTATVSLNGKLLLVESPYNPDTVEIFRKLQGRWDPALKAWKFPYELKDEIIAILKNQGMEVNIEVPENLKPKDLENREAAANKIRNALAKDPRAAPIGRKMMNQLVQLGLEDVEKEAREKERLKGGMSKTDWMKGNINTDYWKKMKGKKGL